MIPPGTAQTLGGVKQTRKTLLFMAIAIGVKTVGINFKIIQ